MDLLQECAASFKRLLPYQYHFTIGRKGKMLAFTLDFDEADFHHLAGLHKLRDIGLETFLDSNEIVFRFNEKMQKFSLIKADYLLENQYQGNDVYLFLAQRASAQTQVCRSFFPKQKLDYTSGQPRYTLLKKEKVNTLTGTVTIQYDRLTIE